MKKDLIETDKIFCEECKLDKEKAWTKYLTKDSLMVTPGSRPNILGKDSIQEVIKSIFSLKNMSFIWKPELADVSDDLTLGYTTGSYTRRHYKDSEIVTEKGKYLTIWKKENGLWKISLDIGN